MDTTYGPAAPALSELTRTIREYSLFQAVLLVVDRLRPAHPHLSEDDLYDQLEFQANPSLGFPGSDVDQVEFFEEHGQMRARLRFNVIGLVGSGSPLPAFYGEQALGIAETATRHVTFLICSIIACNGCCCRSGKNTVIAPVSRVAHSIRSPRSFLR